MCPHAHRPPAREPGDLHRRLPTIPCHPTSARFSEPKLSTSLRLLTCPGRAKIQDRECAVRANARGTPCSGSVAASLQPKHYPCAVLTCRRPSRAMDAHTYIGEYTTAHGSLSLTLQERLRHIAIVGATGSGKSTLLRHFARQDIERGDGCSCLISMVTWPSVLSDVDRRGGTITSAISTWPTSAFPVGSMSWRTRSPTIALRPSMAW